MASLRHQPTNRITRSSRGGKTLITAGAALAAAAVFVNYRARQAERAHPPTGRFIEVDGVRLHFVERGEGRPLVLLHGNGAFADDFDISGIVDLAASRFRVIAFDRPGFGYSERPPGKAWNPDDQAELLHHALQQLGIEQPIVLGHSWGTLVALALALRYPREIRSLVLLSGYYFPTARPDVPLMSMPAIPLLGDAMRHTISPLLGRLMWPGIVRALFGPAETPPRFDAFPVWMALRPSQLRASATESALMIPAAKTLSARYGELNLPVVIMAGTDDRIADAGRHSARLHEQIPHSDLRLAPGLGHMVHHLAPAQVMAAIDSAAAASRSQRVH